MLFMKHFSSFYDYEKGIVMCYDCYFFSNRNKFTHIDLKHSAYSITISVGIISEVFVTLIHKTYIKNNYNTFITEKKK